MREQSDCSLDQEALPASKAPLHLIKECEPV